MQETGIDISDQESTQLTTDMLDWADIIITVCGHADKHCPAIGNKRKLHWPLADPARAKGTEEESMTVFRDTRDEVRNRTKGLIAVLKEESCAQTD